MVKCLDRQPIPNDFVVLFVIGKVAVPVDTIPPLDRRCIAAPLG
jgi:hypothetical protein